MREILFRAKKIENGAWVEGDLIQLSEDDDYWYILPDGVSGEMYEKQPYHFRENDVMCEVALAYVDKDTVSEYTGLRDKNGKRIFEGDIVAVPCDRRGNEYIGVVEFGEIPNGDYRYTGFYIKWDNPDIVGSVRCSLLWWRDTKDRYLKVIGNKWDNPELLEG